MTHFKGNISMDGEDATHHYKTPNLDELRRKFKESQKNANKKR